MSRSDLKTIGALPLFRDMSQENFDALAAAATLQQFPQHAILYAEGSLPEFLHIVVEGTVELFGSHDRHETAIDIIQPVSFPKIISARTDDAARTEWAWRQWSRIAGLT
ncbi:MAG: hypothetical protein EXQ82_11730 [Pseudolabrys sp.]|nr:hypothetical protein [Pseudolabrys sp.]